MNTTTATATTSVARCGKPTVDGPCTRAAGHVYRCWPVWPLETPPAGQAQQAGVEAGEAAATPVTAAASPAVPEVVITPSHDPENTVIVAGREVARLTPQESADLREALHHAEGLCAITCAIASCSLHPVVEAGYCVDHY